MTKEVLFFPEAHHELYHYSFQRTLRENSVQSCDTLRKLKQCHFQKYTKIFFLEHSPKIDEKTGFAICWMSGHVGPKLESRCWSMEMKRPDGRNLWFVLFV